MAVISFIVQALGENSWKVLDKMEMLYKCRRTTFDWWKKSKHRIQVFSFKRTFFFHLLQLRVQAIKLVLSFCHLSFVILSFCHLSFVICHLSLVILLFVICHKDVIIILIYPIIIFVYLKSFVFKLISLAL
jgi:hypothetical protein